MRLNKLAPLTLLAFVVSAALAMSPQASTIGGVATNAELKAVAAGGHIYVLRQGFYSAGDGGGGAYAWSSSACSLNAGAGDDGAQVSPGTGTGCWLLRPEMIRTSDSRVWGAKCDGSTNDAAKIQAQIRAVVATGGGDALIPPRTCKIETTLTISNSNVSLKGSNRRASIILCATGASDCIDVLGADISRQIAGNMIKSLRVLGSGLTGGTAVFYRFVVEGGLDDVVLDGVWNGFAASGTNDIRLRDTTVDAKGGAGRWGLKWYSASGVERSDVLTLEHVTVQEHGAGADCMIWNDNTQTLRIDGAVNLLGCAKGLRINTGGVSTYYPQFLQANGLEIDSAGSNALITEGHAASLNVVNSQLTTMGTMPAVDISGHTDRFSFVMNRIQGSAYAIQVERGATHCTLIGNDFNGSATGGLRDLSGDCGMVGGVDYDGSILGSYAGAGDITLSAQKDISVIGSHIAYKDQAPTVSGGGTGAAVAADSTDGSGTINTGSGDVKSVTLNFHKSFTHQPVCSITPSNIGFTAAVTSRSRNAITIAFSTKIPATAVYYSCVDGG